MNEIIQPLRAYSSLDYMLHKRNETLKLNNIVPLIASNVNLLPFIVSNIRTYPKETQNIVTTCEVVNIQTGAIHDVVSNLTFKFGYDNQNTPTREYIFYQGTSLISRLPQGNYYIHLKNAQSATVDNEWFLGPFKIGPFTPSCTFEFYNEKSIGHLWMPSKPSYYKAIYEAWSFDQSEFNEYSEVYPNDDNYDIPTYKRFDKLRAVQVLGDSNTLDVLKIMQMCKTNLNYSYNNIYLTDEAGKRSLVEIMDIQPEPQGRTNYMSITVKYRVLADSIISVVETPVITAPFMQIGHPPTDPVTPPTPTPVSDGLTFDNEDLTFGGKTLKFK
jgi:hypothetical protein